MSQSMRQADKKKAILHYKNMRNTMQSISEAVKPYEKSLQTNNPLYDMVHLIT